MLTLIIIYFVIFCSQLSQTISGILKNEYYLVIVDNEIITIPAFPASVNEWVLWIIQNSFIILVLVCFSISPWLIQRRLKLTGDEKLQFLTNDLSANMGVKKPPKVFLTNSNQPYSFVFGRTNKNTKLVLSKGLLETLNKRELASVISHELAHIKNRDVAFMTWGYSFLRALKYYFAALTFSLSFQYFRLFVEGKLTSNHLMELLTLRLPLISVIVLTPFFIINSVSRVREFLADATVSLYFNKRTIKSALIKIYSKAIFERNFTSLIPEKLAILNPSHVKVASKMIYTSLLATHPKLSERIQALDNEKYLLNFEKACEVDEKTIYVGILAVGIMIGGLLIFTLLSSMLDSFFNLEAEKTLFFLFLIILLSPILTCILLHVGPLIRFTEQNRNFYLSYGLKKVIFGLVKLKLKMWISMSIVFIALCFIGVGNPYIYYLLASIMFVLSSVIICALIFSFILWKRFPNLMKLLTKYSF